MLNGKIVGQQTAGKATESKTAIQTNAADIKSTPGAILSQDKHNKRTADHLSKPTIKTRVIIRYDVGFNNALFIRGQGANLRWEKGLPLKNIGTDLWVWETDSPFTIGEFKILVNDQVYEEGANHPLKVGAQVEYTPHFPAFV